MLWFTGLSGSGKTTIAKALHDRLTNNGKKILMLDGDKVRSSINQNLGFSRNDIRNNNLIIAELVIENQENFDVILVPIISPYISHRNIVRNMIKENFNEIYIQCSLQRCIKRDTKGLYEKALRGEITNMIGIADSNPYEPPQDPDLIINTEQLSLKNSLQMIESHINFEV